MTLFPGGGGGRQTRTKDKIEKVYKREGVRKREGNRKEYKKKASSKQIGSR